MDARVHVSTWMNEQTDGWKLACLCCHTNAGVIKKSNLLYHKAPNKGLST